MNLRHVFVCALGLAACSLPPFEHEGERVVVATNVVDDVCAGTLARLDDDIATIEERLGLPPVSERIPVAILKLEDVWDLCSGGLRACSTRKGGQRITVLSPGQFEFAVTHENVHTYLGRRRGGSVPLFYEGIAVALQPAYCPRVKLIATDQALAARSGRELNVAGYYMGGELVAWLLEEYGPEHVLQFLASLERPEAVIQNSDPEVVRANYHTHFGGELDVDIYENIREPEQLSAEAVGCTAPALPLHDDRGQLQADLDCGSTRVQNDFLVPGYGYIEWTLTVPTSAHYRLRGRVPPRTWLGLKECRCNLSKRRWLTRWSSRSAVGESVELDAGTYLVRWHGPLHDAVSLDVQLEAMDTDTTP